jgi:hypothetical protein
MENGRRQKSSSAFWCFTVCWLWPKSSMRVVRFTDSVVNLDLIPALKVLGYSHLVRFADEAFPSFLRSINGA